MSMFRKKPVVIEARQFTDIESANDIIDWALDNEAVIKYDCEDKACRETDEHRLLIRTLEGDMCADKGDWIIKGVNSEFYPCKPDIFEKTYEVAS